MVWGPRWVLLVALALLMAGCATDPGAPEEGHVSPGSGEGGAPAGGSAVSCRTHKETVLQWDLPAMRNLTGDGGSEAFSVPTLTASLQIVGSSGPVVAAKWGFSIEDRSGNQTWSFQTGGATTYLGPDANVPDDEIHLGPGTYGFHWNARGYIERMEITITAQVCA